MTLEEYQTITGITVSASNQSRVTAEIARNRRKLESLLGYTLDPDKVLTNYYSELGKTSSDYACPIVDTDNLLAPDPVVNAYRLFDYNPQDEYLAVDPYTTLNAVKLVYLRPGASPNGVTVRTFDPDYLTQFQGNGTWHKYIGEFYGDYRWWPLNWYCGHSHKVQLAVDADWGFATTPTELNDLIADMTTFYSDADNNVKSESILTHSVTRFERTAPETLTPAKATIAKYAGPKGTVNKQLVV